MKKIIIAVLLLMLLIPTVSAISLSSVSWFVKEPERNVISISNPSKYNETDLIRLAEQKIDIHNWATWNGGKMTPYKNTDGTYYLSDEQKQLIKTLYNKGQKIFWIGITSDHINFVWQGNVYDETANAIKAYTTYFRNARMWRAKVGVYIPVWHDEIITRHRQNMTWQEQYDLVENARTEVKSRLTWFEWFKVKWTISGQDFMIHDEQKFQLTNKFNSYWMHHTAVTQPYEAEDLVYHHVLSEMANPTWKETWVKFGKFAWTDYTIVEGLKGNRQLTELGEKIFNNE